MAWLPPGRSIYAQHRSQLQVQSLMPTSILSVGPLCWHLSHSNRDYFTCISAPVRASSSDFAKMDYYDPDMCHGSEEPADASKTIRVLTVMRADEY